MNLLHSRKTLMLVPIRKELQTILLAFTSKSSKAGSCFGKRCNRMNVYFLPLINGTTDEDSTAWFGAMQVGVKSGRGGPKRNAGRACDCAAEAYFFS
ncbi:hypothetical protein GS399_20385 [Pedobacter sp. HMF7647]|uniref:Uncharacterized protein n=1 Tax=Hufsiella arboris TaxID=2695275 RepID=A0A7K1YFE9_9SPHI|nr:hypothetical protein [Hufsiella arboris]MXV53325.1 hypothetical protein [Hufsiella arboris]